MQIEQQIIEYMRKLINEAANERFDNAFYAPVCEHLHITKMYYTVNFGSDDRYRDQRTGRLVVANVIEDRKIILYDNKKESGEQLDFAYFMGDMEYVHAYIEFEKDVKKDQIDYDFYESFTDMVYLLTSHQSMRHMLEYAENTDAMTGIPNLSSVIKKYNKAVETEEAYNFTVLRINLQNFRYINEAASPKCGDEAIIRYARTIVRFVEDDEAVGRLGGDNFIFFVHNKNSSSLLEKLRCVVIDRLVNAPKQRFEISAWVGISNLKNGENKPFLERMNEANIACMLAKTSIKKSVVVFNDDLAKVMREYREIIANFRTAINNNEFRPYYQPKVDMRDGSLVGFEAICRWVRGGKLIYPDRFIPVLDKEGLIPDLDLEIFDAACKDIKRWKEDGLNPPRISINFSKKNLFVQDVEYMILDIIKKHDLSYDDIEIEITESVRENESERLIEFIRNLKENGLRISIDDFGTGYSSLALIHSIDADVIKIDKSFIEMLPNDPKSRVLLESVAEIAGRLNMTTIAEGVENEEQGRELLSIGCNIAQGYFYSRPVSYEEATAMIKRPQFRLIEQS